MITKRTLRILLLILAMVKQTIASSAFCFPSYGHSKPNNPTASRVPTVGNEKALIALGGL